MELKWLEEGAMVDGAHVSDESVGVDRPEYLVHREPHDKATVFFDGGRAEYYRSGLWETLHEDDSRETVTWDVLYDLYELYSVAGVA